MSRWTATPLLLLLPLVWRAGLALARRATREERLAQVLAPGLALTAWLLAIHVVGLATHSFYAGLWVGTIGVAGLGAWSWWRRQAGPSLPSPQVAPAPLPESAAKHWWFGLALFVALAAIAGPELRFSEHDECLVTGHVSLPLQMQNGIYPPRYSTFPQFEVRYHYAIDLAAAVFSTLLGRLEMQPTVHLLAVALWGYSFLLLWVVGERLIGAWLAGPITAFGVLLAGGAPFFCRDLQPSSLYLMSDCAPGGTWITPPLISNFLQHPWSLGIPLFLVILLLLALLPAQSRNPWWWLCLSLLFAALSLAQVILFVCLLPTVVLVMWLGGKRSGRRLVLLVAWAAAIFLAARLMHGFFAPGTEPESGAIHLHPYWLDASWPGWLAWNWDAMGLLLPLGLAGFFFFRPRAAAEGDAWGPRLVLLILAGGSLLSRNLFVYAHSWDIVKFSMVSQIALALLTAALLARAIQYRPTRLLGALGLVACCVFGVGWSVALSLNLPGLFFCKDLTPRPTPADEAAIAFLRAHIREGEGVFLTDYPDAYAIYGGLPTWSSDWGVGSFGFSQSLFEARHQLVDHPSASIDPYLAQSFRWMVVRATDAALTANVARWVRDGRAELAAEIPPLKIYRLKPPDGSR